jgi:hypothetical protein
MIVLALAMALVLVTAAPAGAGSSLRGEAEYYFNLGFLTGQGDCTEVPWAGNIEFDGVKYGVVFVGVDERLTGAAYHYRQTWTIYADELEFSGGILQDCPAGDIAMSGVTRGTNALAGNLRYAENGTVDYAAGAFEGWLGRNVHSHGAIHFDADGVPTTGGGAFNIN